MKLLPILATASLSLGASVVNADALDTMKTMSRVDRCVEVATLYGDGMNIYNKGYVSIERRISGISFQSVRDKEFYTAIADAGFKYMHVWVVELHEKKVAEAGNETVMFENRVTPSTIDTFYQNLKDACTAAHGRNVVEGLMFIPESVKLTLSELGDATGFVKSRHIRNN